MGIRWKVDYYRLRLDSYQPLREVVCETLRTAIIEGVLKPGERLMEIRIQNSR